MIRRGSLLSRSLALLVAGAPVLAAFGAFVVWAADAWRDASQRLRAAEQEEQRLSAQRVQAQAYDGLLARWREYASTRASGLWPASDDERLAAEMASRAAEAIGAADGAVLDWALADAADEDGLRVVRIELVAEAPAAGLNGVLDAIETPTPFVMVERLVARAASIADPSRLELRLRLSAGRLAEPAG